MNSQHRVERTWLRNERAIGLAVFDLDGTLLPDTTACREIARAVGKTSRIDALESMYQQGRLDSCTFARLALASWEPNLATCFKLGFDGAPVLDGLDDALAELRSAGFASCLITMAPRQFAECFSGFDFTFASDYPDFILGPEDKPKMVAILMRQLGVRLEDVVAFGDSDSDVPLFRMVPCTVAVNAQPCVRTIARYHYNGTNILDALGLVLPEIGA
jgi:phosphoserine phosphatase